jgi:hypothetical protein
MDKLLDIVKGVAPTLATALGGPLAGAAVTAIAEKFGVEDSIEAVTTALQALPPSEIAKLKEIDTKRFELMQQGRDSARKSEVAMNISEAASWLAKNTKSVIALVSIFGGGYIVYAIFNAEGLEGTRKELALIILGAVIGNIKDIYGYYFGDSDKVGVN